MWFDDATIYQIYPLGLCGAPLQNDGSDQTGEHRILRVLDWVEHIKKLGATCVLFNPLFDSDAHGYDTRDYNRVDPRLGTKEDFQAVCKALHEAGIRVMLDGVFNHVGRGFWAFRDVQEKKWDSAYKDWFHISFDGNTGYNDGFWYEAWEGCYELVKLNLRNPAVKEHLFDAVRGWVRDYDIDGLRLDVAYCLDLDFLAELRGLANSIKPEFALMGETLHGDYNRWMNDRACHAVTNYECYKGLYSSFNSANMHEIAYSLNRQFGSEQWCLYTGRHLLSFLDNHDVSRIATVLTDKAMLRPAYGLLFGMPGVPAVYYGSEWGLEGDKKNGDATLRPAIERVVKAQTDLCNELMAQALKAQEEGRTEEVGRCLFKVKMGQPRHRAFLRAMQDPELRRIVEKYELTLYQDTRKKELYKLKEEMFFTVDEKTHDADLMEKGREVISPGHPEDFVLPDLGTAFAEMDEDPRLTEKDKLRRKNELTKQLDETGARLHTTSQLLKAYCIYEKDVEYVVKEGKVIIIDQNTGREMPGRRWSDGLHQAVEAKEGVEVERENQTYATITIQNYFRLYKKLAGMTGTAETEAAEFHDIYKLDVLPIPTNRPCIRKDQNDLIFKSRREKFNAVVNNCLLYTSPSPRD